MSNPLKRKTVTQEVFKNQPATFKSFTKDYDGTGTLHEVPLSEVTRSGNNTMYVFTSPNALQLPDKYQGFVAGIDRFEHDVDVPYIIPPILETLWTYCAGGDVTVVSTSNNKVLVKFTDGRLFALKDYYLTDFYQCFTPKKRSPKKPMRLIGISGLARSGKDTVAEALLKRLGSTWSRGAFADVPKAMLNVMGIDTSDETKDSTDPHYGVLVRKMMQTLATEWGRETIDEDIWIKAFERTNAGRNQVVVDVRHENEAAFIRKHGFVIHIQGSGGIPGNHSSEDMPEIHEDDYVLHNTGTVEQLLTQIGFDTIAYRIHESLKF